MLGATQCTLQRAVAQIELRDVIAELADVARQREALVVGEAELSDDALCLHANELEGQLSCAHDSHVRAVVLHWSNTRNNRHTREVIDREVEGLQAAQPPDRRRDGACRNARGTFRASQVR